MMDAELLASAKSGLRRKGKKELVKYLEGGKISRSQAVKAKCYDCDGMGELGECNIEACPLFPYSPYKTRHTAVSAKSKGKDTNIEVSISQTAIGKSQNTENGIVEAI